MPQIITYDRADYKADHQNWSIAKDCDGYIYVANTDGVLQYNGLSWKLIPMPSRQIPRALYVSDDCRIYVSGYEFFGTVDRTDRAYPTIVPVQDQLLVGSKEEIWNIFGEGEEIYCQSFSNLYSYYKGAMKEIPTPTNIMLGAQVHSTTYIPKIEKGIYLYEKGILAAIPAAELLPADAKVAALAPYSDKQILVGTQYHGLFVLSKGGLQPVASSLNEQLIQLQINKITPLRNGGYAIGTILGGLFITDADLQVSFRINKTNGLANNTVLSLYEQENGDLWVGLDKGINLIRLSSKDQYYYDKQGQLGSVYTSIVYQGTLYLGTNQGLFAQQTDGTYQLVGNSQGQIWSMIELAGDLLIGHNTGTYHLQNGSFDRVSEVTGAWTMLPLGTDRILQTTYTGLVLLKKEKAGWTFDQRLSSGNIPMSQAKLAGHTLLGHHPTYGVCQLTLSEDYRAVVDRQVAAEVDGLSLSKGVLLALPADTLGFIVNGQAYIFTDKGPQKTTGTRLDDSKDFYQHLRQLGSHLSLTTSTYVNKSEVRRLLLLGIDEGYVRVCERDTVTAFPELDYVLRAGELCADLKKSFGPTDNDISIQCKDTSYYWNEYNLQYRVLGWDDNWFDLPSNGLIELLNLDDGDYEVKLRSQSAETSLTSFTISPYWYESWPGYLLYALLSLVLVYFIRQYYKRKLQKQKHKLQLEKKKEIESTLIKSENERLEREVRYKTRMLENSTMTLVHKNKMLAELKEVIQKEANKLEKTTFPKQKLYNLIDKNIHNDNDWEIFEQNFASVHEDFLDKLKLACPDITTGELKLAAYIKMNLASKEIAPLLNISVRSIENKRYRLRKKLEIPQEITLKSYLLSL